MGVGRLMGRRVIGITGRRFGRLVVLELRPERNGDGGTLWHCRCDCGGEHIARGDHLRRGTTKSCGCLRRERGKKQFTKHGMWGTRAYRIWQGMLTRCLNPRHRSYSSYGGRDDVPVTVCERWRFGENGQHPFLCFLADMDHPPPGLTIDRTDNSLGYMPSNCKWATRAEQVHNRRPPRPKPRRAALDDIQKYAARLARAASASSGVGAP